MIKGIYPKMQEKINLFKSVNVVYLIYHFNKVKNKNHSITSIGIEKDSDKIQVPISNKTLQKWLFTTMPENKEMLFKKLMISVS